MAEEDSVKTEEEKPEEKEENNKKPAKEEDEEEEAEENQKEEEEEEEAMEESKETEPEKVEKDEEEPKEANEVKKEAETPKKKRKPKKEDGPAKEVPSTPKKDPEVPLYDQPLELSGKRDRKKVERFVQEAKKEEVTVTGNGVALGDIPYIDAMITKMSVDELKILHRVAYSRPGSGSEIKKNLRKFSGFPFSKDDKKYQSKLNTVEKIVMSEIKKMLMILGLERVGNKGEVMEKLMVFMMKPEDFGRKPPADVKKAKARGRPSKKSLEKKENNTSQDDSGSSRSDSNHSGSEQDDQEEEEEEEEAEVKPKKKPGRKPAVKKTPGKRTPAAKKTPASKRAKPTASDDSDSDDEPLAKKVKQPPSDAELKVMVKKILEGANLEEVTMKSVCRQVYDSYPDFDLTHKKVFIKETVRSIIS